MSQGGRKMSTPILHGGSKFRQGVLQLMIHSIDPLYEEPINMAAAATTKKGDNDEILKDHVHPPGAAHCPICGEEKHGLKLNTNGVYHASKTLMADKNFANGEEGTGLPNEAVIGTHAGNLPPQESVVCSFSFYSVANNCPNLCILILCPPDKRTRTTGCFVAKDAEEAGELYHADAHHHSPLADYARCSQTG